MKLKFLALFCAVMVLLGAVPAAALEGEAARAADILATLGLLDDIPDRDLSAPATRAQAAVLLVRLAGAEEDAANDLWISGFRDVPAWADSAVTYAAHQKWINGVTLIDFKPGDAVTANAWCAFLLRMLGYSESHGDFTVDRAAVFAQRIGLVSRSYSGPLTQADLFETAVDALRFTRPDGVTVAEHLVSRGVCSQAALRAVGVVSETLTARQAADRHMAAVAALRGSKTQEEVDLNVSTVTGSAFFIDPSGIALTNYHTIQNCIQATLTLCTGETYPIASVLWYDAAMDLAVVKVSPTAADGTTASAFAYLELAGTADIRAGDTVYALGNPLGEGLAVSAGVISATARVLDSYSQPCVMSTADISEGSSGGALLNEYGRVIAVTSGAYTYGNAMFLAVPVDPVMTLDLPDSGPTLAQVKAAQSAA